MTDVDYVLRLNAWSLASRFGFGDGDMPDTLMDLYDREGVEYPPWRPTLCLLVREHLLPALPVPVEVYELDTNHNPIRAVDVDLAESLTEEYVEVTWAQIEQAARTVTSR